ncbi:hypothetical protein ACWCV5_27955 [Streptomyces tubercidicus]
MTHHLIKRPEQRYQCSRCRAAFLTREGGRASRFECPGVPLAHGIEGRREHVIYPTWSKDRSCATWGCPDPNPAHQWHGPDPYCDELSCLRCMHACDCDVCEGRVWAPGLFRLVDSHEV